MLAGSLAFFVLSLGIVALLRQEFIPSQDMSRFTIRFQTPVGTSLDATDRYFRQIESFLIVAARRSPSSPAASAAAATSTRARPSST